MIAEAVLTTLAAGVVIMSTVVGRQRPARRPTAPVGHEGIAPSWTRSADLAPGVAEWLKELHREQFGPPPAPVAGSDEWWAAEFERVRRVLARPSAEFHARVCAVAGPDMATAIARHEQRLKRRWAAEQRAKEEGWHATPEFWRNMQPLITTGEWPIYERAELVF